jgi:RNA polymerase sigma-70 factor (ECF subfamily)
MIVLILPDISAEDALLERMQQGDSAALRQIYDDYYTPVYQFIRFRTDEIQTAEDLAAEVFLKLVDAFHRGRSPRQSLRGWLFRVARNLLHDHYGRRRITETTLEDWLPAAVDEEPESAFIRSIRIEAAQAAIRQLTDEQQEVLILRFGQMLNLQETADIMGKPVNSIKQLQLRALRSLRRLLSESAEDLHG